MQGGYFYLFSLSLEGLLFSGFGWDEKDPICFQEIFRVRGGGLAVLDGEDQFFARRAPAIVFDDPGSLDHAVARDQQRNRVGPDGAAHGADGFRLADRVGVTALSLPAEPQASCLRVQRVGIGLLEDRGVDDGLIVRAVLNDHIAGFGVQDASTAG